MKYPITILLFCFVWNAQAKPVAHWRMNDDAFSTRVVDSLSRYDAEAQHSQSQKVNQYFSEAKI